MAAKAMGVRAYKLRCSAVFCCIAACGGGSHRLGSDGVLPPPSVPGWSPSAATAPGGHFVAVTHFWAGNQAPNGSPDALLYDGNGKLLLALPEGEIEFDRTGSLALHKALVSRHVSVIDLETLRAADLGSRDFAVTVYE